MSKEIKSEFFNDAVSDLDSLSKHLHSLIANDLLTPETLKYY